MIYDTLAGYYDDLVKDEEAVAHWVAWMQPYLQGKEILELACGSGEITCALANLGYDMHAMDLSSAMVEKAKSKDSQNRIDFSCGDMTDLHAYGMYDAILCFCDSINYLSDQGLLALIEQAASHLKPGGVFCFDTHSLDRLEEFSLEFNETGEFEDGVQYQWSIMSEDDCIYQDFAFYKPDGTMELEHHVQRVFDPQMLADLLAKDFDILSITTDFDLPGIQEGEKYFYICKKRGGGQ